MLKQASCLFPSSHMHALTQRRTHCQENTNHAKWKNKKDWHAILGVFVIDNRLTSMPCAQRRAGPLSAVMSVHTHKSRLILLRGRGSIVSGKCLQSEVLDLIPTGRAWQVCVIVACSLRLILLSRFLGDIMCLPTEQRWVRRRTGGGEGAAGAALPSGLVHDRVWACSSQVW